MNRNEGFVVWFTGLPSSGKSTLAQRLKDELIKRGFRVEVLDGDVVREHISRGLGFSKEDRDENIRRIYHVAYLLKRNGVVVITAAISPYREIRQEARELLKDFVEVYASCPVEKCIERDVKGMYKKALAGEIKNFTGIDDPYEPPENPEVVCETDKETVEESVKKIINKLIEMGYIEPTDEDVYTEEEEEIIKKRLEDLGYI
ncbi:MAG TPA: adenylyl-sulfate kinase [candidate division WOR-3 bacterium]|uniref:Adenylyl-sulfate kinase n=1 Tax=candidate division WOR-3 bacterium TaxID=2052148 RepID=A0A7C0VBB1_UNCW3|nr:adenylyl-sulfate kinase [candidate division WOR-3 bacterium]